MDVAELEYSQARGRVRAWFREQVTLSLTPVLVGKRKTIPNSFTVLDKLKRESLAAIPPSEKRPDWVDHR